MCILIVKKCLFIFLNIHCYFPLLNTHSFQSVKSEPEFQITNYGSLREAEHSCYCCYNAVYKTNIIAMLKYRGGLDLGERYGVLVRNQELKLTSVGIRSEMKRVIGMQTRVYRFDSQISIP